MPSPASYDRPQTGPTGATSGRLKFVTLIGGSVTARAAHIELAAAGDAGGRILTPRVAEIRSLSQPAARAQHPWGAYAAS